MAKEKMIVFVFDTTKSCESEDLADAVLYFHPVWVSESQRHALCGQIIGTAHCIEALFSRPSTISLMSGKFALQQYLDYTLAIGSDRDIPDWVLKNRVDLLTSLIKTYHGDLSNMAAKCTSTKEFSEKLYTMFETYLPVLQYGCHIFQKVPLLTLPKSACNVFLESKQVLEHCLKYKGVLGGVILYNNKIIASQLPPDLTSHLVVVDPYRIKSPAETIKCELLPEGSQLLVVYISKKDYTIIKSVADIAQTQSVLLTKFKENREKETERTNQYSNVGGMKRDQSLLFTAVIEEDQNKDPSHPNVIPFSSKPRQRPSKLTLANRNVSLEEDEVMENKGITSVCTTPMVEYKQLFGNVVSICQNDDRSTENKRKMSNEDEKESKQFRQKVESYMTDCNVILDLNNIGDHYVDKPVLKKPNSVDDLQGTLRRLLRLKKTESQERTPSPETNNNHLRTINDPSFPIFLNDGTAVSQSLYQYYFLQKDLEMKRADSFENFDSNMKESPKKTNPQKSINENDTPQSNLDLNAIESCSKVNTDRISSAILDIESNKPNNEKVKLDLNLGAIKAKRNSLSLQLSNDKTVESKRTYDGVQMTPLIEQLSSLATDWSSCYGDKPLKTPMIEKNAFEGFQSSKESEDSDRLENFSENSVKLALFVTGFQNMSLVTLMDLDSAADTRLVHNLWDHSLNNLGSIEQKCIEVQHHSSALTDGNTDYSHLVLDPDWGGVRKGGPWASADIAIMAMLHDEFNQDEKLEEFVLRSDESVVLGSKCGGAEVYYQENCHREQGPPGPSDSMASAPLRAKRRLHNEHSYVIF